MTPNQLKRTRKLSPSITKFIILLLTVIILQVLINSFERSTPPNVANVSSSASTNNAKQTQTNQSPNISVVDSAKNSIEIYNYNNDSPPTVIKVGNDPVAMIPDPTGLQQYVINKGSNNVSVISMISIKAYKTIAVGNAPVAAAIDSATGILYVVNSGSNSITSIQLLGLKVIRSFYGGPAPVSIAIDQTSDVAYIVDQGDNAVLPVNLSTFKPIAAPIAVASDPIKIMSDQNSDSVGYVLSQATGTVSIISYISSKVIATLNIGGQPTSICEEYNQGLIYVTLGSSNQIVPIDLIAFSPLKPISMPGEPTSLYCLPNGNGFVIDLQSLSAKYFSLLTGSIINSIPLTGDPVALSYSPSKYEST